MKNSIKWPLLILLLRTILAMFIQIIIALFLSDLSISNSLKRAGDWFTVYGTIIDIICLYVISIQIKKEELNIFNLINFKGQNFIKVLGESSILIVILMPISIIGMSISSYIFFGTFVPQKTMGDLPLWASFYSIAVWPVIWAFAEQLTYQGYSLKRILKKIKYKWIGIIFVSFCWALQHIALPFSLDWKYVLMRFTSFIPVALIMTVLYLRSGKLLPFIIAHWFMDFIAALTSLDY